MLICLGTGTPLLQTRQGCCKAIGRDWQSQKGAKAFEKAKQIDSPVFFSPTNYFNNHEIYPHVFSWFVSGHACDSKWLWLLKKQKLWPHRHHHEMRQICWKRETVGGSGIILPRTMFFVLRPAVPKHALGLMYVASMLSRWAFLSRAAPATQPQPHVSSCIKSHAHFFTQRFPDFTTTGSNLLGDVMEVLIPKVAQIIQKLFLLGDAKLWKHFHEEIPPNVAFAWVYPT